MFVHVFVHNKYNIRNICCLCGKRRTMILLQRGTMMQEGHLMGMLNLVSSKWDALKACFDSSDGCSLIDSLLGPLVDTKCSVSANCSVQEFSTCFGMEQLPEESGSVQGAFSWVESLSLVGRGYMEEAEACRCVFFSFTVTSLGIYPCVKFILGT